MKFIKWCLRHFFYPQLTLNFSSTEIKICLFANTFTLNYQCCSWQLWIFFLFMSFDYIWFSATRNLIFFSHLKENRYLATSLVLSVLLSSDLPSLTLSANSWCCLQKNLMAHTVRQQKSSKFSLRPFLSIAQNEAAGAEALSELLQRTLQ